MNYVAIAINSNQQGSKGVFIFLLIALGVLFGGLGAVGSFNYRGLRTELVERSVFEGARAESLRRRLGLIIARCMSFILLVVGGFMVILGISLGIASVF